MKAGDLKHNDKNPRKMSAGDREKLKLALEEFGDLGCIIFNRTSGKLVGGHMRSSVIPPDAQIEKKNLKEKSPTGTVAEGFIKFNGENFKYREVEWDAKKETEAMLAANKHSGQWDYDVLRLNFSDIPDLNVELTGFTVPELKQHNIVLEMPEITAPVFTQPATAAPTTEEPESDEEYVKNTPETTEQIPVEKPNNTVYENIKEKTEIEGKRFLIIINCPNQDIKDSLREKLQPEIEQAGCKIF